METNACGRFPKERRLTSRTRSTPAGDAVTPAAPLCADKQIPQCDLSTAVAPRWLCARVTLASITTAIAAMNAIRQCETERGLLLLAAVIFCFAFRFIENAFNLFPSSVYRNKNSCALLLPIHLRLVAHR